MLCIGFKIIKKTSLFLSYHMYCRWYSTCHLAWWFRHLLSIVHLKPWIWVPLEQDVVVSIIPFPHESKTWETSRMLGSSWIVAWTVPFASWVSRHTCTIMCSTCCLSYLLTILNCTLETKDLGPTIIGWCCPRFSELFWTARFRTY